MSGIFRSALEETVLGTIRRDTLFAIGTNLGLSERHLRWILQTYDGPAPPRGHGAHHYHFRLAALDAPSLPAPDGAGVEEIWRLARKHILEEAELIGVYQR